VSAGRLVRVVRRLHLFAGLAMLPWVMLYGTTAFLFNHPSVLRPGEPRAEPELVVADSAVLGVGSAELTTAVRRALGAAPGVPAGVVAGPVRGAVEFAIRSRDTLWNVAFDVSSGAMRMEAARRERPAPPATFQVGGLNVGAVVLTPGVLADRAAAALRAIRGSSVVGAPDSVRVAPEHAPRATLSFAIRGADTTWQCQYDLGSGVLTVWPRPNRIAIGARDLLTSFHKTHEFPNAFGPRWIWAVLVDGMAALLWYWALSGVVMWWQYRTLRKVGGAVLAVSVTVATVLAVAMYLTLTGGV
jgi:hypothetical protein